jgi:hypothetical protein
MIAVCSAPRDGGTREFSRLKQQQEDDLSKKGMDRTWRRNVSLESRYGTCRCFPFATSTRIMITSLYVQRGKIHFFAQTVRFFKAQAQHLTRKLWIWAYPRVERDLLMLAASFNLSPSAPESFCLFAMNTPHKITVSDHLQHQSFSICFQ